MQMNIFVKGQISIKIHFIYLTASKLPEISNDPNIERKSHFF